MTEGLPSGTVTLVLGDVESSTEHWEASADAMATATRALNATIDALLVAHNGARPLEQGEGDNFVAAFTRAADGLGFAVALQGALAADDLRVRVGIHTGDVALTDNGYAGPTIIRAARIRDAGHGGQVLLSSTTADLAADYLDEATSVDDLGEHHLKGLTRPERLWQLVHPSLRRDFPAVRLADDTTTKPVRLSSFIGREVEAAHVRELVKGPGCVTITGAGGAGKTRLALELLTGEPGWFIDLASVDRDEGVAVTVAEMVGARLTGSRRPMSAVAATIGDKDALLVLDNCEHLLTTCSELAATLLSRCEHLTILATSREPLGIEGEVTYRLPSMAESEATQLFVERARRANPQFVLDDATTAAVTEICQRLDGMPLAIELAAARMRVFTAPRLLDALHDRFRLLTGGARTALPRQRTLEASVDWSYALLLDAERMLLRRLSVFAGGFTTDAAVAVGTDDELGAHHVFELLVQLVEKSLIVPDDRVPGRFLLLETIRHFAAGRLAQEREVEAVRQRHYEFFTDLVHRRVDVAAGFDQGDWIASIVAEIANLRRALQWASDQPGYEALLRLAGPLARFWTASNYAADGAEIYAQLDERTALATADIRARVLCQRSCLIQSGTSVNEGEMAREGIALARAVGDDKLLLACILEGSQSVANAFGGAEEPLEEAMAIATRLGDEPALAIACAARGFVVSRDGDNRELGAELLERSIVLARRHGLTRLEAMSEGWLAMFALMFGGPVDFARTHRAAEMLRQSGEGNVLANLIALSAPARALSGDQVGADRDIAELDVLVASIGDEMSAFNHRIGHGMLAFVRADWETAIASLTPFAAAGAVPYLAPAVGYLATAEAFSGRLDEADRHADLLDSVTTLGGFVTAGAVLARAIVAIAREDLERAWEITYDQATGEDAFENSLSSAGVVLFARITALLGKHEEAVRIAGAVVQDAARTGVWSALLGDLVPVCRAALGDTRFDELWADGAAMGGPQAVALVKRGRGRRQRPMLGWDSLTPTEAEVAALVSKGVSNKDVATQLFMSEATVKTHLTRIYSKVGVKNRAQLAASARQPS